MNEQLTSNWPKILDTLAFRLNPWHEQRVNSSYYGSVYPSEWAVDTMFGSAQTLNRLYPKLASRAILAFNSEQIMRYLRDVSTKFSVYQGRVVSDLRKREEGFRVKHGIGDNSLKMYDKPGGVLRVETTIDDPGDFKSYRPIPGKREGAKAWLPMRKGIADLHRRAEVSHAAAERYYNALATLDADSS